MAENDQNSQPQAQPEESSQPVFMQQRYYLKDASFEAPHTPAVFKETYSPNINFNLNNRTTRLEEALFESVLRLTAEVKQDDRVMFLAEVQFAGIFEIRNVDNQTMEVLLNVNCPTLLFPFAKEALESMVVKASFPPLMLAPVNFEVVYQQAKARHQAEQEQNTAAPAPENTQ